MAGSFKAYLHLNDGSVEVRRFGVPNEQSNKFAALVGKLSTIFPTLSGKEFAVYYHDDENEEVVIGSDEELEIALLVTASKDPYRLHIRTGSRTTPPSAAIPQLKATEGELHSHVTCDGCDGPVRGYRYKCMECPDYDLCAACEMKAFHPGHKMMRIPIPSMMPPYCPYMKRNGPTTAMPRWGGRCGRFSRPFQMKQPEGTENGVQENKAQIGDEENQEFKRHAPAEYLRNIGEAVSSMLDVLGIDVQVDVIPPRTEGGAEGPQSTSSGTQQPEAQNQDQTMPEAKKVTPDREVPPAIFAPGMLGWTLVNSGQQNQQKENAASASSAKPEEPAIKQQEKPEVKPTAPSMTVEERTQLALERMFEMGFNNEGNWLGQLLMMKNGSIDAVLEILNPRK